MSLLKKALLIAACMDDGIVSLDDAVDLLVEHSAGGLTPLGAQRMLTEPGGWTPLLGRHDDGRWTP